MAFTLQSRSAVAAQAAAGSRSRCVRVCAAKQGDSSNVQKASAFAAFAAAALLNAHPADAGVILEQPQIKKVLQDTAPSAPAPKREIILPGMRKQAATSGAKAAPASKRAPEVSVQGGDLDPRAIALPGTLALIAGGAYALTKVDEGFEEFMDEASCKDSGADGAGYETAIKGGALAVKGKSRPGTKKVKASASTKSSGGTGFSLGGLLNKE